MKTLVSTRLVLTLLCLEATASAQTEPQNDTVAPCLSSYPGVAIPMPPPTAREGSSPPSPRSGSALLSSTNYFLLLHRGEAIQQPNGNKILVGGHSHGNVVSDAGETTNIWCDFTNQLNAAGESAVGTFHCQRFDDNGDALWVAGVQQLPSGAATWTVLGGTGRYQGATGSGTTETASQRADGCAWISKSKGTLTIKGGT